MTEDDLKQFLDSNRAEIQAAVKQKMISALLETHRWKITDQIGKVVTEFVAAEIVPMVRAHLASEKGAIIQSAITAASEIGDTLAKALVVQVTKNLVGNDYQSRQVFKALFDY